MGHRGEIIYQLSEDNKVIWSIALTEHVDLSCGFPVELWSAKYSVDLWVELFKLEITNDNYEQIKQEINRKLNSCF